MIEFTRLPGYDTNGNPRYVCHFLHLLTQAEKALPYFDENGRLARPTPYERALKRARLIGGKKYRAKSYGGGIVFTEYESVIRKYIIQLVAEAEQAEKEGKS